MIALQSLAAKKQANGFVLESGKMFRLAFLALAAFACQAQPSTPVILISVDTLRADRLGSATPHINALGKNGTLFTQVGTPFPLTLPAHVALLTSTYPFASGVQDNGVPLGPGAITLATVLKKAGYRTGAFVGSFVLDRRFGLNRGFDVYDGPLDLHNKTTGQIDRKRPGAQVAEAAMRWVERNSSAPFFLFLHLYDLHLPYDLAQGYDGELAYVDRVLGEFLAFLERRRILQKALIVFTSDHGEGLGDHGESTHGYFIYQSTLHVPLLIHWPAGARRIPRERVDDPAGLLDVAPTILDAIGVARPGEMRGRSLIGAAGEGQVYSESLYARNHFGCATLRSLRSGRYKYIEAPKPEFYDLSSDPKELRNVYDQQRPAAAAMSKQIAAVRAGSPAVRPGKPTPESVNALRSLGYLGGSSGSGREPRVDPKDRIGDFEKYFSALSLASTGRLAESGGVLEKLRDKLPDVVDIQINLGLNQKRLGQFAQAAREFQQAIKQAPKDAEAHYELGFCHYQLRQFDDAARELKTALALEPWYTLADEALAEIYIQKQDFAQARAHLNHLLSIDPNSYTAHYNLGIFAAMRQNWTEAQRQMLAALQSDPGSAEAHNTLGMILQKLGKTAEAEREFRAAQESGRVP